MAKNQNKSIYIYMYTHTHIRWVHIAKNGHKSNGCLSDSDTLTHAPSTQSNSFFKMFYTWLPRSFFSLSFCVHTFEDVCAQQAKTMAQYSKRELNDDDSQSHFETKKKKQKQTIVMIILVFSLTCVLAHGDHFYFNCCMWSFFLLSHSFSEDEIQNNNKN